MIHTVRQRLRNVVLDGQQQFDTAGAAAHNPDSQRILGAEDFAVGEYELVFQAGAYLRLTASTQADPLFLDVVPIRFGMNDPDAHYHVPLLLSPFGYSRYRGS